MKAEAIKLIDDILQDERTSEWRNVWQVLQDRLTKALESAYSKGRNDREEEIGPV